jgi:hypothetical protein
MGVVMITCPRTGRAVPTGIETDPNSFASLPDTPARTKCPVCDRVHVWWKREAWLSVDGEGGDVTPAQAQPAKKRKATR